MIRDPLDANHVARVHSNAPGPKAGPYAGDLSTRYTPVAWGVQCLLEVIRRTAREEAQARVRAKRRILALHDRFAETHIRALSAPEG